MAKNGICVRHRQPDGKTRKLLLARQCGRCAYCHCELNGLFLLSTGRVVTSGLHWDHIKPWSYVASNKANNYAATCQQCNSIKSNKVFDTIEEIKAYVRKERIKRGLPVFELPSSIPSETAVAKVLPTEMQDGIFLEEPRRRKYTVHRPKPKQFARIVIFLRRQEALTRRKRGTS